MARNFRRFLAIILSLSLAVSLMTVPALADEGTDPGSTGNTTVTGEGTPESPTVTTTTNDDGSTTVTTESQSKTETSDADGNTTIVTESKSETKTTDKDGNVTESGSTTTTKTVETGDGTQTTNTSSTWGTVTDNSVPEGTFGETEEMAGFTPSGDPKTDSQTVVEGSESESETVESDSLNRPTNVEGEKKGSETETTTTTKTEEGTASWETDASGKVTTGTVNPGSVKTDEPDFQDPTQQGTSNEQPIDVAPDFGDGITVDLTPGTEDEVNLPGTALEIPVPEQPKGSTKGTDKDGNTTYTTENGNTKTVVTVKEIKDISGNVIGYSTTTVATTEGETTTVDNFSEDNWVQGDTTTQELDTITKPNADGTKQELKDTVEVTIDLPVRPEAGNSTDADTGTKTEKVVQDIYEVDADGKQVLGTDGQPIVIGYQVITTETDTDGNVSTKSESLFGTKTTTTTQYSATQADTPYSQVVTITETTPITQGTTFEGYFYDTKTGTVWAKMGTVNSNGKNQAGNAHGDVILLNPTDYIQLNGWNGSSWTNNDVGKAVSTENDLFWEYYEGWHRSYQTDDDAAGTVMAGDLRYIGRGLMAGYFAEDTSGSITRYHNTGHYAVKDSAGKTHYVYCIELGKGLSTTQSYDVENLADVTYFSSSTADADKKAILNIAQNGFWGINGDTNTTGSLAAVKEFLKNSGYDNYDSLTIGQALTATQAALWTYGTQGEIELKSGDSWLYDQVASNMDSNGSGKGAPIESTDKANILALYKALIATANNTPEETTNVINEDDITGSSITVKDKLANGNYSTDVAFSLAVEPGNGDVLNIRVLDSEGNTIDVRNISGGENSLERVNGSYTITGLELSNGTTITLNLEGTQNLGQGVYVFSSKAVTGGTASQTFAGLTSGTQAVNLNVDLTFEVTEPTATRTNTSWNDTQRGDRVTTSTRTDTKVEQEVTATIKVTTEIVDKTETEWQDNWEDTFTYPGGGGSTPDPVTPDPTPDPDPTPHDDDVVIPDEDVPLTDLPEEDVPLADLPDEEVPLADLPDEEVPLEELPDDPVPLAAVPKTGDESGLWFALVLFAAGALAGVTVIDKKRKEET